MEELKEKLGMEGTDTGSGGQPPGYVGTQPAQKEWQSSVNVIMQNIDVIQKTASEDREKINEIKKEIIKPPWLKDFINSINSIAIFIKIILSIFLLLIILLSIIFVIFSYFRLQYLLLILEHIRDNKSMEINKELLQAFNSFYYYAKKTINIYVVFIFSIGIVALLGYLFVILSKYWMKLKNKKTTKL